MSSKEDLRGKVATMNSRGVGMPDPSVKDGVSTKRDPGEEGTSDD